MLYRCLISTLALAALVAGPAAATHAHAAASRQALAAAEARLAASFAAAGVAYPPVSAALVALKSEARLELWADSGSGPRFVRSYLVRAGSGRLGPKLRQGDHQVPEGVYRVSALNPDSRYHLSLRLDYPNDFDRARAREDGRSVLGGDIMIHGDVVSDGCLPIGDGAIEEVFALAERIGVEGLSVIVSPLDLRRADAGAAAARAAQRPPWLAGLYAELATALRPFPLPAEAAGAAPVPETKALRAASKRKGSRDAAECGALDAGDCLARCTGGDAASCARAGLQLAEGRGVPRDVARAWPLLEQACTAGDARGCGALGQLVLADDGARRDAARAAALASAACDGGDGHGCYALAKLCTDRTIYPVAEECTAARVKDLRQRAVAALRWDCRGWGAYDCRTLAAIYAAGDAPTATRLAGGSCDSGDAGGCEQLARLYESAGDRGRARSLYDRACSGGWASACERIAAAGGAAVAATVPSSLLR
jgi:TPR repeat protein